MLVTTQGHHLCVCVSILYVLGSGMPVARCTRAASVTGSGTVTACWAPVSWPKSPPAFSSATGSMTRRQDTECTMTSPGTSSRKNLETELYSCFSSNNKELSGQNGDNNDNKLMSLLTVHLFSSQRWEVHGTVVGWAAARHCCGCYPVRRVLWRDLQGQQDECKLTLKYSLHHLDSKLWDGQR